MGLMRTLMAAATTGTIASIATSAALAAMARSQGKGAVQPVNATSHWLHGEAAGDVRDVDLMHTGVGYGTHHASAIFWALPLEFWLASRPHQSTSAIIRDAAVMGAIAAAVDYGVVPRRLTPGWENVLPKSSIAATFGVLTVSLAAGALLTRSLRQR